MACRPSWKGHLKLWLVPARGYLRSDAEVRKPAEIGRVTVVRTWKHRETFTAEQAHTEAIAEKRGELAKPTPLAFQGVIRFGPGMDPASRARSSFRISNSSQASSAAARS